MYVFCLMVEFELLPLVVRAHTSFEKGMICDISEKETDKEKRCHLANFMC